LFPALVVLEYLASIFSVNKNQCFSTFLLHRPFFEILRKIAPCTRALAEKFPERGQKKDQGREIALQSFSIISLAG